ncbi:MAG: Smr/MutS family protein [Neisseriaceae bacterium]|nr:Smr/MutS family protein [Neisseriaceae bacterium]
MNFQEQLKNLHKQAKEEARVKQQAALKAQQAKEEEPDFASLMSDVIPLKSTQRYVAPVDKTPIKVRKHSSIEPDEDRYFYIGEGDTRIEVPDTFSKNGQGSNDIKRLQAGHWEVVADVDLHGYTQEEAQQTLNEFIEFLKQRGVCGEIIHGSGLNSSGYVPKLKTTVRRWLMQHPDVLAYCEPRKGNDGAVRILIKRQRKPDIWAEDEKR